MNLNRVVQISENAYGPTKTLLHTGKQSKINNYNSNNMVFFTSVKTFTIFPKLSEFEWFKWTFPKIEYGAILIEWGAILHISIG